MLLAAAERRLRLANRLAAAIRVVRAGLRHAMADILRRPHNDRMRLRACQRSQPAAHRSSLDIGSFARRDSKLEAFASKRCCRLRSAVDALRTCWVLSAQVMNSSPIPSRNA